jgi:linalool 8-monooxygenase
MNAAIHNPLAESSKFEIDVMFDEDNSSGSAILSGAGRRTTPHPTLAIDLKNPDFHSRADKYEVFRQLRRQTPVYWNPEIDSSGFWAVTRYDDILKVVQDSETFSADALNGGMRIFNIQDITAKPCPHLLSMDPPRHTQLRKALQPLFSAQNVDRYRRRIEARAKRVVDVIATNSTADAVKDIAVPMTLGLLVDLISVQEVDSSKFLRWSNAFVGDDDSEYLGSPATRAQMEQEFDAYIRVLYEERRDSGASDFVSLLLRARPDGQMMDFDTFSTNIGAFVIAANETSRHTICSAFLALNAFPDEKAKLIADPSLIPIAAKELIRWSTPLMHVRRTATRDTVIGEQPIRRGDKVVVWYGSANRDESIWPDADKLDVCRYSRSDSAIHLSFGAGPHHCLGWRFAELQLSAILAEVLKRLPELRTAAHPHLVRSNFISGFKILQLAFIPERRY